ncbi:MAG: osmotically inducible protein OsmC [Bacteroidetes bacterium 43-93]|nr:OsmC family protein [Bacteroidota bacterium]OJX01547.1 MAG: osmotically inducible protein OsmC [Bacteroidetes bacterium 43-93]
MVTVNIELVQKEYGFEAVDIHGNKARFDNSLDHGGQNFGVSPMQSMLMALGTCSGIDVVSILKKMRQDLTGYKMVITGEREKKELPAVWEKVHVVFYLNGSIEEAKANQAITLSIEKYCSVAETLRRAGASIIWELKLNEQAS